MSTPIPIQVVRQNLMEQMGTFVFANNLMQPAAGLAIGLATKQVIEKVLELLVLPILVGTVRMLSLHRVHAFALQYVSSTSLNALSATFGEVAWSVLLWILTIFLTIFLLEYFINRTVFGLKSEIKDTDSRNFVKAKLGSEQGIIPSHEQVKAIHAEEKKEQVIANQIKKEQREPYASW